MRQPLGVAVVGGLVFSQLLTLYVTPTFYVSMERVARLFQKARKAASPLNRRWTLSASRIQFALRAVDRGRAVRV